MRSRAEPWFRDRCRHGGWTTTCPRCAPPAPMPPQIDWDAFLARSDSYEITYYPQIHFTPWSYGVIESA